MKIQYLILICLFFLQSYSVSITDGIDEGQDCFVIATTIATYYYQKKGGAFSSIIDQDDFDWVSYKQAPLNSSSGNLRGIPSLLLEDSLGHPGFEKCTSTILNDSTIQTTTNDNEWEWQWLFSECKTSMTIKKVLSGAKYTFMYNGPPGGSYLSSNYWGNDSTGLITHNNVSQYSGNINWAYFGDTSIARVLFLAKNSPDTHIDFFDNVDGANDNGMFSFGFGRTSNTTNLLSAVNNTFTLGFLELNIKNNATHAQAVDAINYTTSDDINPPLFGVSVTTHWLSTSVQGGWGNIVRHDIVNDSVVNNTVLYEGKAFYPKINIEGTQITFVIKNDTALGGTVAVMNLNGDNLQLFPSTAWTNGGGAGFIDWPIGRWVYYLKGEEDLYNIWRVNVDNGTSELAMSFKNNAGSDTHPWLFSMNADGTRMTFRASNFYIYYCHVPTTFPTVITLLDSGGIYNSSAGIYGCQHSISATGNFICYGPPIDKHHTIRIKQWWDTSRYGCLDVFSKEDLHSWEPSKTNSGGTYHNNRWANNSDDWICASEENTDGTYSTGNQVLYNWRYHKQVVVTKNDGSVISSDGPGDFFVDTSNHAGLPIIKLDKIILSFEADSGVANPQNQNIIVSNASGGILNNIFTSTNYTLGANPGWLSAQKTAGSGNQQTITNSINISSLKGGNYRAIVTIAAPNAKISQIYTVNLTVNANRIFSTVTISPDQTHIFEGDEQQFTATALDQFGDTSTTQPTTWTWNTNTNATITSTGLFVSNTSSSTPYSVITTGTIGNITISDTVLIWVENAALTLLSPNGSESFTSGDTMHITWTSGNISKISAVAIDFSSDDGKTWETINTNAIAPADVSWGNFVWNIQINENNSNRCKIKVRDYQNANYRDISDAVFSINSGVTSNADAMKNKRVFGIIQKYSNKFSISIPLVKTYSIDIVSVNGKSIIQRNGKESCIHTFSIKDLAAGLYIIRAMADRKVISQRVLLY